MGKRATRPSRMSPAAQTGDVPAVSGREPCPCGSGRRYKACHGRAAAAEVPARPFEGLAGECDLVAMREIVPAATAEVTLAGSHAGEHAGRTVTIATLLPMAWPALVRQEGQVLVGLQVGGGSGDPSRDAAAALLQALAAEPGTPVIEIDLRDRGPRLQDVVDVRAPLDVSVHQGFDFWLDGSADSVADIAQSMKQANEAVVPTARLESVEAAYWCQVRDRNHLRWVMPHDESRLLDALARLHAAGADQLGEDTRYVGSFRADGLLVPVWDLEAGTPAEAVEQPAAAFAARLEETLADSRPLDDAERRARAGLRSRQVTLR